MTQPNGRLEKALLGTKDTSQLTALMNPCQAPFENQILESTGRGNLKSNRDSPSCKDLATMILSDSGVEVSKRRHDWTERCVGQISLRNTAHGFNGQE